MPGLFLLGGGQWYALDERHLDLVGYRNGPDQRGPTTTHLLRHRNQRRDIVARMGPRRHTIMEVQLAHGRGIGPARPLGLHPEARRQSEERRPMGPRVG